ncbi:MAG TPA: hypothetical protein VL068_03805 [Microthrixaceae bacterium]|nr:hypothetical protein [Microthrixaceae bacterium]
MRVSTQDYRFQAATPALLRYESIFGALGQGTESGWGDYPHDEITAAEFEVEWQRARAHLRTCPREQHFARDSTGDSPNPTLP